LPSGSSETKGNGKGAQSDKRAAHEAKLDAGRRKRAVVDAEKRVADLDAEKARLEARFAKSDLYADPSAVITLQLELDRVRMESERAFEAWEQATTALDNLPE
jgi:ABC transporter C-terminal domain